MMRYNRPQHKFTRPLQPVKFLNNDAVHVGLIISRFHKLPKNAKTEEPFYIITGFGLPIWEENLKPITDEEYRLFEGGK